MEHVYEDLYAKLYDIPFGLIFRHGRKRTIELLDLKPGQRVLEIGVGTGLMLPMYPDDVEVVGIDISRYALDHAIDSVQPFLKEGTAAKLPWPDHHFDLVVSINTLHNLYIYDLYSAFTEIERSAAELNLFVSRPTGMNAKRST